MELYKGRSNTVEFEAPDELVAVSATWTLNGLPQTTYVATRDPVEPSVWTVNIPYIAVEGKAEFTWTFGANSVVETYEVVTPYLSHRWIKKNILPAGTNEQIADAEAAARHIVNVACGQTFGTIREVREIRGTGESSLRLPGRVINLYSVYGEGLTFPFYDVTQNYGDPANFVGKNVFYINGDGWWLNTLYGYSNGIKSDMTYTVTGPIFDPLHGYTGAWGKGKNLLVDADWGWTSVPAPVQEAMKLLVNDYACDEAQYRDNYLESMTSADWRIQFNAAAYGSTGNVRADQLLAPYFAFGGWAVI